MAKQTTFICCDTKWFQIYLLDLDVFFSKELLKRGKTLLTPAFKTDSLKVGRNVWICFSWEKLVCEGLAVFQIWNPHASRLLGPKGVTFSKSSEHAQWNLCSSLDFRDAYVLMPVMALQHSLGLSTCWEFNPLPLDFHFSFICSVYII